MTTTPVEAKPTAAQKAWTAATKHTAATLAEIDAAREQITAAEQELATAKAEAEAAITARCADPSAARERIQSAREGIRQAEDNLDWAQLQLQAAEVVHRQAYDDEQAARRRVTIDEYQAEHARWNDPENREHQLLTQLTDILAELVVAICDRKDEHDRLAQEWQHVPADERPKLPTGQPIMATSTRLIGEHIADITPEISTAIKAGAAAAQAQLTERRRAAQHG